LFFFQWNNDAASDNLSKRHNSAGWKGLCSLYGHEIHTDVFDFWLQGFKRAIAADHKRKIRDELDPEFVNQAEFEKYALSEISKREVWAGVDTDGVSWQIAFDALHEKARKLLSAESEAGPSGVIH